MTDAGTTVARAVVHDRPTWLAYLQLGLFGYYLYAFGPSIGLLRDDHGYTRTVASLHGTALAVGSVLAGLVGASVVRRIGRGGLLRAGSAILALGILVYTGTSPLALTVLGAFVASLGGTLIMVGVNAFLPDHQGAAGPRSMSEAHALGAGMGLLGPLAVGIGAAIGWGWRVGLLVTIVGLLAVEIARGRNLHQFDGPHGRPDSAAHHAARGPLPRLTWFAVSVFGLAVGTEFCLTLWGSDLLRDRAGLGSAAAAAALVTIVGGMALGRILAAPVVSRVDPDLVLMGAMGLTVVGFGFAWLSSSAVPMLVGFAITGLGLGPQSPLGITRAVVSAGPQADRGAGMTSVAAGVASGAAPFLLAALADSLGVRIAFLLVPLLLAAACTLVVVARVPPPTAPPDVD